MQPENGFIPFSGCFFVVPHFQTHSDYPFGFAVGLRTGGAGKLLIDAVLKTGNAKRMMGCAFVLATVVGTNV